MYILIVDLSHWSTFANILGFDRVMYDSQLKEMLFFFIKTFSINSDTQKLERDWIDLNNGTEQDLDEVTN